MQYISLRGVFTLLVVCLLVGKGNGQESSDTFDMTTDKLVFDRTINTNWIASATLDPIDINSKVKISIPLLNGSADTLTVGKPRTDCGCSDAKIENSEWSPGGTNVLELTIRTPPKVVKSDFASVILLDALSTNPTTPKLQLQVRLKFPLKGLFNFSQSTYPIRLNSGAGEQAYEIPFLCTVSSPDVAIDFSGDPIFVDVKSDTSKPDSKLILLIDEGLVGEDGAFGRLTIRDKKTGKKDSTSILIDRSRPLVVSPKTLRFVKDEEGSFVANAVLRLSKRTAPPSTPKTPHAKPSQSTKSRSTALIEASIEGGSVKASVKRISTDVYRVRLTLPPSVKEKNEFPVVTWRVRSGGDDLSYSSNSTWSRHPISLQP